MKKALVLSALFFLLVSTGTAAHPLIGKWKLKFSIGATSFTDYITITSVNTKTRKVKGTYTEFPWKLTGYYLENIVFILEDIADVHTDAYYFTFKGTPVFAKHLSIDDIPAHPFCAKWHPLLATKISNTTKSLESITLNDFINQKILKRLAHLREIVEEQ